MSLAVKDPVPADFQARAEALVASYNAWLAGRPAQPVKRAVKGLFRSKAERAQIRDYDTARFQIDTNPGALRPLGKVG